MITDVIDELIIRSGNTSLYLFKPAAYNKEGWAVIDGQFVLASMMPGTYEIVQNGNKANVELKPTHDEIQIQCRNAKNNKIMNVRRNRIDIIVKYVRPPQSSTHVLSMPVGRYMLVKAAGADYVLIDKQPNTCEITL